MLNADWSDGVRLGPMGSDWVISHTGQSVVVTSVHSSARYTGAVPANER